MSSFNKGSYTEYGNKIGLYSNSDHSFISSAPDVVLNFPYKDCVLVGGMTKEDAKRDERFLNTKVDQRDIDTLFEPKVLTDFKYVDQSGERTLTANDNIEFFDENGELKQNLLIKGNNLIALHTLRQRLAGKVKLIYIDPPYNTGNDGFRYNDSFNHSSWLTFMENRLRIARELLSDDGLIFISVDDNEQAYLKILMDEVFSGQFVNTFVWLNNPKGRQIQDLGAAGTHEYITCYAKSAENVGKFVANSTMLKSLMPNAYKGFDYEIKEDSVGKYITTNELYNSNPVFNEETRPNLVYDIFYNPQTNDIKIEDFGSNKTYDGYVYIEPHKNNDGKHQYHAYRWSRDKIERERQDLEFVPYKDTYKIYTKRRDFDNTVVKDTITDINGSDGNREMSNLGLGDFSFPKPEKLLMLIIQMSTAPGDIVLDYHLGSGTTAAVAQKMGRRWIGIEQMDYIETIAKERMKKVIAGEQGGISKSVGWQGGGSFVYLELKKYNEDYKERILAAETATELDAIRDDMLRNAFLKFWINRKDLNRDWYDEEINERKVELINMLDENQLYLNYADMNDAKYSVTANEKALTDRFYGANDDSEDDDDGAN